MVELSVSNPKCAGSSPVYPSDSNPQHHLEVVNHTEIIRNLTHDRSSRMWQGDYLHLPYLGSNRHCDRIRLLWHGSYWDGPINGFCLYDGRKCLFDTADEVWFEEWEEAEGTEGAEDYYPAQWENTWSRRFIVFETTPEDLEHAEFCHELFRKHVGWHTDYADGKRAGGTWPQEEWAKFYDWSKTDPPRVYDKSRPLAWFGFPGPQPDELAT